MRAMKIITGFLVLALVPLTSIVAQEEDEFTDEFPLKSCHFLPWGGNAYFRLRPGRVAEYSNQACVDEGECDALEEVTITVLGEVEPIQMDIAGKTRTIRTRVIEEFEQEDGELVEVSRNFFATCYPARDVYYFGETVDDYEDGVIVGHDGEWRAGVDGAMPGIIMPDETFLLGARYMQEIAPGVAEDRAEHVEDGLTMDLPAGRFHNCVAVEESSPLDPPGETSDKVYCPNVGLVFDDDLELTSISN